MGHYLLELTIALLLLNQLQLVSMGPDQPSETREQEDEECFYWFLKEPPHRIFCDPYPYQILSLSCTLLFRNSSISATNIHWYYRNLNSNKKLIDQLLITINFPPVTATNNSNYVALTAQITVVGVREGGYYCRPEVMGVLPSALTTIEPYGSYRSQTICDAQQQSELSVRCAQKGDFENRLPAEMEEIVHNTSSIRDLKLNFGFSQDASPIMPLPGCLYQYMVEPFRQLACNPYEHDELILVCMILADGRSLKLDREFNIRWYYNPLNGQPVLIHKKSFNFAASAESRGILYVMKISNVQDGEYYCQPFLEDIGLMLPSTRIEVRPQESYDRLMPCETGFPVQSSSALQCIITLEDAGCTVNEFSNITRSGFDRALGEVRLNDTMQMTIDPPIESSNPPIESSNPPIESSNPPIENGDTPTDDNLPVWVYILAGTGGVLLVGATSIVLLVTVYCYRRKLKTRPKHVTTTRQGQNGERVHTEASNPRGQARGVPLSRWEGVNGPSVLSIANTVIQELSEVSEGHNRETAHIRYSDIQQEPSQHGTEQTRSEGVNGFSVHDTRHTQSQSGVAVRCSIQTLQGEGPYYSYPRWNVQQQNSEDDEYIYMHTDSSAANSHQRNHTGHSQERESQASTELEPAPYEVPDPYTIVVNSTRSSRPSTGLSAGDRHHKYKGLKIETKDYVSMYDIVVRIPRRGASKSCVY